MTDTAVVILSYNSRKWHERFLPGIVEEMDAGYNVYVVDHASTDDTHSYIRKAFPQVSLIRLKENHGFAWGYAEALKRIEAKYFLLLSADFEVTRNWFTPLRDAMEADPQLGACQPKIRYYKDKSLFEYAGAAGGFMDSLGYMFCRGRLFDSLEQDIGQYDTDREIFWAGGGCLMLRSDAYVQAGGLDPDLFAHMEEIDLCWRIKKQGYRVKCIAGSTVFHVGGSIISYGSPQKTFYNFRNSLILLLKNENGRKLCWLLPLRLVLDGVAAAQMLFKGQFKQIAAVWKAHFDFYRNFGKWYAKRQAVYTPDPVDPLPGRYKGIIIIDYFLRRKKLFSQLDSSRFT